MESCCWRAEANAFGSGAILAEGLKLGTKVYLAALEFPGEYALLYWLTAIVMSALVVTLPSEICRDTALPVGVPAGMATLI